MRKENIIVMIWLRKEKPYVNFLWSQTKQSKKFSFLIDVLRVILYAGQLSCLEEVLWIIAAMASETVYDLDGKGNKEDIERARARCNSYFIFALF